MNEMSLQRQTLTIKELSEKLDIPKPTLRFWEKELEGIIVPLRSSGGQRRYTESHITLFEQIKELRNAGKSLSQIKEHFNNVSPTSRPPESEIDMLTKRISDLVKIEVTRFLDTK
ncbi:MAG: MerR family transcriptional regulator [Deltaproteobacteria bacterium]|nr:MerR family transcriptional regulator [Deltaproteobacteria bacterium]